jgi:hypothetical protein
MFGMMPVRAGGVREEEGQKSKVEIGKARKAGPR